VFNEKICARQDLKACSSSISPYMPEADGLCKADRHKDRESNWEERMSERVSMCVCFYARMHTCTCVCTRCPMKHLSNFAWLFNWHILSEKCLINVVQNLNRYIVMMDGKGGNSNTQIKLNHFKCRN
jgi:hypothetical protein